MPIEIREAKPGDEELLVALTAIVHELHAAAEPDVFKPFDRIAIARWIGSRMDDPKTSVWIAETDGEGVGCLIAAHVEKPETPFSPARRFIELDQIVVRPAWRRRGVARALANVLFSKADCEQIRDIVLTSWSFNEAAHRAFARLGFSPVLVRFARNSSCAKREASL